MCKKCTGQCTLFGENLKTNQERFAVMYAFSRRAILDMAIMASIQGHENTFVQRKGW